MGRAAHLETLSRNSRVKMPMPEAVVPNRRELDIFVILPGSTASQDHQHFLARRMFVAIGLGFKPWEYVCSARADLQDQVTAVYQNIHPIGIPGSGSECLLLPIGHSSGRVHT